MPSPINEVGGRYFFGHADITMFSIGLGTNDYVTAQNGNYLFIANYKDYNLRFYDGAEYVSVPSSFLIYDRSSLPLS